MSVFDFQEATADRIASIFRAATVGVDNQEIKNGGQRRVLLADEVGLGKTHVAKAVIDRVRNMRELVNDDMFRVVYVCSNMSIAHQNISKLEIPNMADVGESRLSMQHLTIRELEATIEPKAGKTMGEIIIPLTPSTSFSLKGNATGNVYERALIFEILRRVCDFGEQLQALKLFFQEPVKSEHWAYETAKYSKRISTLGTAYLDDVKTFLNSNVSFGLIISRLRSFLSTGSQDQHEKKQIINTLRRVFADLSLSMLEPDLIIMDEFQRFSSLIDLSEDSEQSAIVRKFFDRKDGQEPMILLLSATPYKPFSPTEDSEDSDRDEHYKDFNRLMQFLFAGGKEFKEAWRDYSANLMKIKDLPFEVVLTSKIKAEEKMYEAICRTERLSQGLLSASRAAEIAIDTSDISSYCEMDRIARACSEAYERRGRTRSEKFHVPIEYVKSCPYLLSFMDSYELKKHLTAAYLEFPSELPTPGREVLLRQKDLARFSRIPFRNARLTQLVESVLPKNSGAEFLLWIPASMPYYTTSADNPFFKNRDYTKTLVFSAWEMVPRMVSTLVTYEAERAIFGKKGKRRFRSQRLKEVAQKIIKFPSYFLASLYNPQPHFCDSLSNIKAEISAKISPRIEGLPVTPRANYEKILELLRWLDGESVLPPDSIPANALDLLTDMAIASPGVCLLRILIDREDAKKEAQEAADGVVSLFNRSIANSIIDRLQQKRHGEETYLDGVMDYCAAGNLQAVLDEFYHLCDSPEDFLDRMQHVFIEDSQLYIDTDCSFGKQEGKKTSMAVSFALPFAKIKNTSDDKTAKRSNNVRLSFQSPFYPFVLASTSVGQEGLDFHWYCRRVVHWNLPSNPQDIEQREGRINRYKCLAIRRNLSKIFPAEFGWEALFAKATETVRKSFSEKYSDIVPSWCLPSEWIAEHREKLEWIERVVPMYPLSRDVTLYEKVKETLSLYRFTLGQPRQEEMISVLASLGLEPDELKKLLFDLSPISRRVKES